MIKYDSEILGLRGKITHSMGNIKNYYNMNNLKIPAH